MVEAKDATNHLQSTGQTPQKRIIQSEMWLVLRLWMHDVI